MLQSPHRLVATAVLLLVAAGTALGIATFAAPGSGSPSNEAEARAVASLFFEAINARRYDEACGLLSKRFYREHHVPDRKHCVLGLTVGMGPNGARFEITGVRANGQRAEVSARADGAPGKVLLVKEEGRFRIVALRAA